MDIQKLDKLYIFEEIMADKERGSKQAPSTREPEIPI